MSKDIDNKNLLSADINFERNEVSLDGLEDINETNELLSTMDSAPFDQTLEIMSQTLASIDAKMDLENSQLKKLDKLSEIKEQLNRLENINVLTPKVSSEHNDITETKNDIKEEIHQNRIGHNQQEISELLEKIHSLESKIITIENQSTNSIKRFKKLENAVQRFEDLEIQIPSLFKNLFNKKESTDEYKNEITKGKQDFEFEETKTIVPQDKKIATEDVENILENVTDETIINEDYNSEPYKLSEKPKSNVFKYIIGMVFFLFSFIIILFFLDKLHIIDLIFDRVMNSIYSLLE